MNPVQSLIARKVLSCSFTLLILRGISAAAVQNSDVEFRVGAVKLAGTVTLPDGPGPHPALVLLAGGQAIDRDCSYSGGRYKFFKIIAERLADHGVATLRFDSPGVGGSTGGTYDQRTMNDRADEAAAGIEFLKQRREIDPRRIGLLGHSEGTAVAVMAASRRQDVAFLVLLSAYAKSVGEGFPPMRNYYAKESGVIESKEIQSEWARFYIATVFPAIDRGETNWAGIADKARSIARKSWEAMPESARARHKDFEDYFNSTIDHFYVTYGPTAMPHLKSVLDLKPLDYYARIQSPVLLIGGGSDFLAGDVKVLADAVRQSGNTNCTARILPNASHTLDNPEVSGTVPVPELLPAVTAWLEQAASTGSAEKSKALK